jgi:type II secretory pathway component PulM
MNARLHQAQMLVARLSPREQRLVAIFGGLLGVVLIWSLVISPFLGGRAAMQREITGLRSELGELEGLARQIRQLQSDAPSGRKGGATARATADFSLLSFVEKAAAASLRPESIASMSPGRRALDGGRQETTVELKLSSATLGELVALLRAIETEASPVYVKQFSVRKRYDDASRFDVTLVTAATLPA